MNVVIPMAGCGQRFVDAGYDDPKPMIPLADPDGSQRRIVEHVAGMFTQPDDRFVFICNEDHIAHSEMAEVLETLGQGGTILTIAPHKNGPVWTVKAAYPHIEDDEPAIVAYCDGAVRWDRQQFHQYVDGFNLDGCLLTHKGFHPHTLSTTRMAFLRSERELVKEVQEKKSFTDNPQNELASSGIYYFRRGRQLKQYFDLALHENVSHNGEFYVTLVFNLMIRDGLRVGFFNTSHVAILGTPCEVENYQSWSVILQGGQVKSEWDLIKCYRYWRGYHNERRQA